MQLKNIIKESGEMMSKIKVILQSSHGLVTLTDEFSKNLEECGYPSIFSIEARMDERLIALVEAGKATVNYWEQLEVVEVDTSRLWYIEDCNGAEYINYLSYKFIREDINFILPD